MTKENNEMRLPWPVELPTDWHSLRLKYIAEVQLSNVDKKAVEGEQPVRLCNYVDVYKNEIITAEIEFMEATASKSQIANFILKRNDVLITKDSEAWDDIAVAAVVSQDFQDVLCGYHLAHLRPNPSRIDGRYLARCFNASGIAEQFYISATGITRFGLGKSEISGARFPVPPLAVQRRIADLLDKETARIDLLIAAKKRFLELLAEKRRAFITHAVTRGLNPVASFRDTGSPWLGTIPANWDLAKFSHRVYIVEGQVDPEVEPYIDMPLIAPNHIESSTGRLLFTETASEQAAISGKYLCRAGDVIYSKIRPALRKAVLATEPCLCSADMYPLRTDNEMLPEYLLWFMLSEPFSEWAVLESDRVAMPKINRETLHEIRLPVPSLEEQRAIADHINSSVQRFDAVRESTTKTLELLHERRSALIAEAVTGQLSVGE